MEELEGKIKVVTPEEHKLMCHDCGYNGAKHMDEKKLNPEFPYRMEKAKWYIMFLLFSHIITPEEFDDLYSRLPEWAR